MIAVRDSPGRRLALVGGELALQQFADDPSLARRRKLVAVAVLDHGGLGGIDEQSRHREEILARRANSDFLGSQCAFDANHLSAAACAWRLLGRHLDVDGLSDGVTAAL